MLLTLQYIIIIQLIVFDLYIVHVNYQSLVNMLLLSRYKHHMHFDHASCFIDRNNVIPSINIYNIMDNRHIHTFCIHVIL